MGEMNAPTIIVNGHTFYQCFIIFRMPYTRASGRVREKMENSVENFAK